MTKSNRLPGKGNPNSEPTTKGFAANRVWKAEEIAPGSSWRFDEYTHIRGYHACRPMDVGGYIRHGIVIINHDDMRKRAAQIFDLPINTIMKIDENKDASPSDQVYFCTNKNELLSLSGHYLCWGSEYFSALAANLDRGEYGKYHTILESTGIPTLFTCDVPIQMISEYQLDSLKECFEHYDALSFCIDKNLEPQYITNHEHPKRIFNSVQWRNYDNTQITCPYCKL